MANDDPDGMDDGLKILSKSDLLSPSESASGEFV